MKKLQALGAFKLLSGGSTSLAAVGGDMTEAIVGIRRSIAAQTLLSSTGKRPAGAAGPDRPSGSYEHPVGQPQPHSRTDTKPQ